MRTKICLFTTRSLTTRHCLQYHMIFSNGIHVGLQEGTRIKSILALGKLNIDTCLCRHRPRV